MGRRCSAVILLNPRGVMFSRRVWVVVTLLAALSGCAAKPKPPRYRITVQSESDPGVPLEGVALRVHDKTLATSDATGRALADLDGTPGDTVALDVSCPEGFRSPEAPLVVLLRPLDAEGRRPEFQVSCPPLLRQLVVAVRANRGPDLPLLYRGREIARTDRHGAAHALLTAAPGDTLSLTLDTSKDANSQLMPQHPELRVTMPERDDVVVFEQTFTRPKPKFVPKPKPPEPELPHRL